MVKRYRIVLFAVLAAILIVAGICYLSFVKQNIPDSIYMDTYSDGSILMKVPFLGTFESEEVKEASSVNLMEPLNFSSGDEGITTFDVKFLGIIKIKDIKVNVSEEKDVVAGGIPVGIYIRTNGILVVDIGEIETANKTYISPAKGILMPGDYITAINGHNVYTIDDMMKQMTDLKSDYCVMDIRRNGEEICVKIRPVMSTDGVYKIGVWVREDCQGLGTLTYIDENGNFGTLGHPINDSQTGELVEIESGRLYTAKIWSVVKGKTGTPGEVIGSINYSDENYLGQIVKNSEIGVYGKADDNIYAYVEKVYTTVGYKQDVKAGSASIRTYICGDVKDYDIDITDVSYSDKKVSKGIVFEVVDEELLELTNGIVQGMSGSPIIQNGKIIGAVTHVFVNDPKKGYGIFIENMLAEQ